MTRTHRGPALGDYTVRAHTALTAGDTGAGHGAKASDKYGLDVLVGWGWADVGQVGGPPVGCDGPLGGCQGDGMVADQGVELSLDDVLDPGPLGAVVRLGPQVGLSARSTPISKEMRWSSS